MSSFFVVVLGASLYLGAVVMMGNFAISSMRKLPRDGSTDAHRAPAARRTFCHNTVIDNKTSQAMEDRIERCDENKPSPSR